MGKVGFYNDDDEWINISTFKAVCPTCLGEGKHVNRAIDGNGITADEWHNEWDDDQREMYLTGGYDVVCEECGGANVIDIPDDSDPNYAAWYAYMQEIWDMEAQERAERAFGC